MARLFEDGFDHYGSDEGNMVDGVYADAAGELSTAIVATGTHSFRMTGIDSSNTFNGLRKVLPTSKDKLGVMARLYFPQLPTGNTTHAVFDFLSSSPQTSQVRCYVNSSGGFDFYRGSNSGSSPDAGTFIVGTDPLITAAAQHHAEIQIYIHDSAGWIRVAINSIHRFQATGLDTKQDSTNIVSVGNHNGFGTSVVDPALPYIDDYIIYDFTGTPATDTDFCPTYDGGGLATGYIGELDVRLQVADGDTAQEDWTPSTGTDSYPMVGKATPNDATYLYSTTVADLTELESADLPVEITYIRGITVWGRMSKSDSGAAMIRFGMKSVAAVYDAPERPVTVEPTYWWDQVNVDPNTSARWTREAFNDSLLRLTRSV